MGNFQKVTYYISLFILKTIGTFAIWHLNQVYGALIITALLVLCDAIWAWLNPEHGTASTALLTAASWAYACTMRVFSLGSPSFSEIFPIVLICIVGAFFGFCLSLLTSSKRFRLFDDHHHTRQSGRQEVTHRKIYVSLFVVPLCGVVLFSCITGRKIEKEFENNVLTNYYCNVKLYETDLQNKFRMVDLAERSTHRAHHAGTTLYKIDGLDPSRFLFATRRTGFGNPHSVTRIIMHTDAQEPLEWLTPKALLSNDGETIVADAEMLKQFCQFVSNPQNGIPAPNKLESVNDPYSGWVTYYNIRLQFDLPYDIYWHALYEIQDDKVILYAHHHATQTDYAYDVTHILGEYF